MRRKTDGRRPGERAGLAREAVLLEARAICAREGLKSLSMRLLARQLGVAPNALYSHFADKKALIDALMDSLLVDIRPAPADEADWEQGLLNLMGATRGLLLAHADLIPMFLARPGRGPNALRLGEATLSLLERAGLEGPRAVNALRILLVYTFGFAALDAPRRQDPEPEKRRALSEGAFRGAPGLRMKGSAAALARHPDDDTFQCGLRWLLAGIATEARTGAGVEGGFPSNPGRNPLARVPSRSDSREAPERPQPPPDEGSATRRVGAGRRRRAGPR